MASLWADYWREKGYIVVETERGFISAIIHEDTCFIDNLYVKPEYRGTSSALQLALQVTKIAEDKGCNWLTAEVYKSDADYAYNVSLHRHFGLLPIEDTEFKTSTAKRINNHDRSENIIA